MLQGMIKGITSAIGNEIGNEIKKSPKRERSARVIIDRSTELDTSSATICWRCRKIAARYNSLGKLVCSACGTTCN